MAWLIFRGYLVKILVLDSHANVLQVWTNLDVFMVRTMSWSWHNLTRFGMFLIKVYQVSVHWAAGLVSSCPNNQLLYRVRDEKQSRMMNLEVQLLMRQGQVEVEAKEDFIHDFQDSILIHRYTMEPHHIAPRKLNYLGII